MPTYRKHTQPQTSSEREDVTIDVTPSAVEFSDSQQPHFHNQTPHNTTQKKSKNRGHKTLVLLLAGISAVVIVQLYQKKSGYMLGDSLEPVLSQSLFSPLTDIYIGDIFEIEKTTAVRLEENAAALKQTEKYMVSAFATRDALHKIELESYSKKYLAGYDRKMSEEEVRKIMMRAGYYVPQTIKLPEEGESVRVSKPLQGKDDVRFAKNVAKDYVREEIEDLVDKVNLLGRVVKYITQRISE